jgi:ribosomal protein L6P/L9E
VASNLRSYSSPDPYKGKGILKKNEIIKLKKKAKS